MHPIPFLSSSHKTARVRHVLNFARWTRWTPFLFLFLCRFPCPGIARLLQTRARAATTAVRRNAIQRTKINFPLPLHVKRRTTCPPFTTINVHGMKRGNNINDKNVPCNTAVRRNAGFKFSERCSTFHCTKKDAQNFHLPLHSACKRPGMYNDRKLVWCCCRIVGKKIDMSLNDSPRRPPRLPGDEEAPRPPGDAPRPRPRPRPAYGKERSFFSGGYFPWFR